MSKLIGILFFFGATAYLPRAFADASEVNLKSFGLAEDVVQGGTLGAKPVSKSSNQRIRIGLGYDHVKKSTDQIWTDSLQLEQGRDFSGSELLTAAEGAAKESWIGQRMRINCAANLAFGRFRNGTNIPLNVLIDPILSNLTSIYQREALAGDLAYTLYRRFQLLLSSGLSKNRSLDVRVLDLSAITGLRVYHALNSSSTIQFGKLRSMEFDKGDIGASFATYIFEQSVSRDTKIIANLSENLVSTASSRIKAETFNLELTTASADADFHVIAGRLIGRRPVTNQQVLSDRFVLDSNFRYLGQTNYLGGAVSRGVERSVFDQQGLTAQNIDRAQINHSTLVFSRKSTAEIRSSDRIVFSLQTERAYSAIGDITRKSLGVGYYSFF